MRNLYRINSELNFEQEIGFACGCRLNPNPTHQPLCQELCCKIDGLIFKVCKLLPKCPTRQPLLTIECLNDASEVRKQFTILSPFNTIPLDHSIQGYFLPTFNTISLSMDDFRTGNIAHEVAHYLMCQFSPIPDMELQEKWAQFVDAEIDLQHYYFKSK